jgi:hypothetical protein
VKRWFIQKFNTKYIKNKAQHRKSPHFIGSLQNHLVFQKMVSFGALSILLLLNCFPTLYV